MNHSELVSVGWLSDALGMDRAHVSRILKGAGLSMDDQKFPLHEGLRAIVKKFKDKSDSATKDLNEAKTRKTAAEAKIAELDLAKREGELVEVAEVTGSIERMLTMLKQRLEALPDQASIQLAGSNTPQEMKKQLTTICHQFLSELHAIDVVKEIEK